MNHDHSIHTPGEEQKSGMRHRLMMVACCIPMFVIALGLVFAGVVSASFLIYAFICTAMMVVMMGSMGHGSGSRK